MSSLKEWVANLLVVRAPAQVKKVYSDFSSRDVDFLDSVIDSDGGYVFLNEAALAVAFDDAGFAHFGVADRNELSLGAVTLRSICEPSIGFSQKIIVGEKVERERVCFGEERGVRGVSLFWSGVVFSRIGEE